MLTVKIVEGHNEVVVETPQVRRYFFEDGKPDKQGNIGEVRISPADSDGHELTYPIRPNRETAPYPATVYVMNASGSTVAVYHI